MNVASILHVRDRGQWVALSLRAPRRRIKQVVLVETHASDATLTMRVTHRTSIPCRCSVILKLEMCPSVGTGLVDVGMFLGAFHMRFIVAPAKVANILAANFLRNLFGRHEVFKVPL